MDGKPNPYEAPEGLDLPEPPTHSPAPLALVIGNGTVWLLAAGACLWDAARDRDPTGRKFMFGVGLVVLLLGIVPALIYLRRVLIFGWRR